MGSAIFGNATGQNGSRYYGAQNLSQGNDAAQQFEPVPQYNIPDASNYGVEQGIGYTPYVQGFTADNKPSWMTGWFDMPQWGYDRRGNALTEADLQPAQPQAAQQQAAPQQAAQQQQQYQTPAPTGRDLWRNNMAVRDAYQAISNPLMTGDYNAYMNQRQTARDARRQQMEAVSRWNAGDRGQSLWQQLLQGR